MIFLLCQVQSCQRYVNKHNEHQSKSKQSVVAAAAVAVVVVELIIATAAAASVITRTNSGKIDFDWVER